MIYVGDGKGADALDAFVRRVRNYGVNIEYVATDLSAAFISAVRKNLPEAQLVFDHFHVKKIINDKVDKLRRSLYHSKLYEEQRDVIKGIRWLLLRNGRTSRQMLRRNNCRRHWKSTSRWQRHTI